MLSDLLLDITPQNLDLPTFTLAVERLRATSAYPFPNLPFDVFDCCGTGGSGIPHYNTSTTVAFILAAGGLKVAKFGNRSATSASGSSDFLDAIGLPVEAGPEFSIDLLNEYGLAFLHAPHFYPVLAELRPLRQRLGVKTIFNFIGPLLNPANPTHRIIGVSDADVRPVIADYLGTLPHTKAALVVGTGEADELLPESEPPMQQFTPETNAEIFRQILNSQCHPYYHRLVCLNAGAAFYIGGKSGTIETGIQLAEELLETGEVRWKYEQLRSAYVRVHA